MLWLAVRLVIEGAGHGDHARVGVDGKPATGIVAAGCSDRVVGRIGVAGQAGHADRGADDRILGHRVGRGVRIGDRADVEFVHIAHRDRERLRVVRAGVASLVARTVMS